MKDVSQNFRTLNVIYNNFRRGRIFNYNPFIAKQFKSPLTADLSN